jgi:murein DD-endopeptidase MepM/ murein hydrolase activator NlpD
MRRHLLRSLRQRMRSRTPAVALVIAAVVAGPATAASAPAFATIRGAPSGARSFTTTDAGAGTWSWPLEQPIRIMGPYRAPATPYSAGHRGIDVVTDADTPVFAPDDGVVHFAGVVVDRPVISIDHGGVLSSFEAIEPVVRTGEAVERGQLIGTVASGGHCDGRCLHLGARIDGDYVSPLLLLGGIPRAVLLPTR